MEALDTDGLEIAPDDLETLLEVDTGVLRQAIAQIRAPYSQFGSDRLASLTDALDTLDARLGRSRRPCGRSSPDARAAKGPAASAKIAIRTEGTLPYSLGVDVGTTFSAAAAMRDGALEMVPLASHQLVAPTVVFALDDEVVFSTTALRRGVAQPSGLAREFKRRVGDPIPIMLSGTPYHASRLVGLYARWVVDTASEQLGSEPSTSVFTHPATWTEFQLGALRESLDEVGLGAAGLLSEPEAALRDFGAVADIQPGELHLVYDLGGGTFDVALLRKLDRGFETVGEADGLQRLGGVDFDEAVFQFIIGHLPRSVVDEAREDPSGRQPLTQLRAAVIEAKEALSADPSVDIPVVLPQLSTTVRLTRSEFEAMVRPTLRQTVDLLGRVLNRAGVALDDVAGVLLVGGSSRIPLVTEMIAAELELPIRVDAHPKLVVARGAARAAAEMTPPVGELVAEAPDHRRRILLAAGAAMLVLGGGATALALRGSSAPEATSATTGRPTTARATPTTPTTAAPRTTSKAMTPGPTPPSSATTPATTITRATTPRSTAPPMLPVRTKWTEMPDPGVRFAVPADWILVDPESSLRPDDADAIRQLSATTGLAEEVLRGTVAEDPVPYVLSPVTENTFTPHIRVARRNFLQTLPTAESFAADLREALGDDSIVLRNTLPGDGVIAALFTFSDPTNNVQVNGRAVAVDVSGQVVVFVVKTLDAGQTAAVTQNILDTLHPL